MTTLAERWKAEGEARGRLEGEARGRLEGVRQVLLNQLRLKFGDLPSAERVRIESGSEEQMLRWTARVLSADSLESVFED